jgi:hypothetical protein
MTSRPSGWALALSFCISACGGGSGGGNGGSTVGSTSTSTPTAAAQCSALSGLAIPASAIAEPTSGATVTSATLVETSGEYCQVNGAISPIDTTAPAINFQVNLPTRWNHKALHYGGGGFDGTLITGVDPVDMAPTGTPTPKADSEIEWLSDNGSCYIAEETLMFSRKIGLKPVTTPVRSPQSNGMAESFVKTIKRDYISWMPKPDVRTALQNLAIAFDHYNESHPHSALKYCSPREFRQRATSPIEA